MNMKFLYVATACFLFSTPSMAMQELIEDTKTNAPIVLQEGEGPKEISNHSFFLLLPQTLTKAYEDGSSVTENNTEYRVNLLIKDKEEYTVRIAPYDFSTLINDGFVEACSVFIPTRWRTVVGNLGVLKIEKKK